MSFNMRKYLEDPVYLDHFVGLPLISLFYLIFRSTAKVITGRKTDHFHTSVGAVLRLTRVMC